MKRLVFLASCLIASTALALPVKLANPGAEEARGDMPAGVEVWTSDNVTARFARDTQIKHSGAASFYIHNLGTDRPQDSRSAVYIFNGPLTPGLNYTATGWVKTRDAVEAGLSLRTKSAQGAWVEAHPTCDKITGTNDWTRIQCTWTATPGQATFQLFLIVRVKGEAWFDDLEVHDDFELPARANAFKAQGEELNQLIKRLKRLSGKRGADLAAESLPNLARLSSAINDYQRTLAQAMQAGDVLPAMRLERFQLSQQSSVAMLGAQRLDANCRVIEAAGKRAAAGYVTGWASPMSHVFLRDCPFAWQTGKPGHILAAKGETEAIQLVLLPPALDLKQVTISARALTSRAGTLAADRITVQPVGFVKTTVAPTDRTIPVERDYQGWWPDPLLDNFAFDVRRGDTQPVWISVNVPLDQPAGVYRGSIRVEAAGLPGRDVPLVVEVADLVQPDRNPWALRNLLSFHEPRAARFYGKRWTPDMQGKFFDFLLDRRVCVLSMYGNEDYETVENLKRFAARGQNVFLLDWYNQDGHVIDSKAMEMRQRVSRFYTVLKELGYIDRAYVYGWDEIGEPEERPDRYAEVRYAAEVLAKEFPGIRLLSAGTDRSYGTKSPLQGLSNMAFCPLMTWDAGAARQSRTAGNQVWWYEINWTIDQPLIRSRMIAWQTYKLDADGFLIWTLNRWVNNDDKFIQQTILADYWNPTLDGGYENSSALYVYPGENGPISSLRLENFRDGSEDYGLLSEARKRLAATRDDAVRRRLQDAIAVSDDLTRDLRTFTTDPDLLMRHREKLIRALVAAGKQKR